MDWKHPCLLYFAKVDFDKKYNIPGKLTILKEQKNKVQILNIQVFQLKLLKHNFNSITGDIVT